MLPFPQSPKITCESLVGVWCVFFYPTGILFGVSQFPWPEAARHVPHLGYLTNWHSTTWSVQLSLSNTRSVALQEARPGASLGRWDLPGRCGPGRLVRKVFDELSRASHQGAHMYLSSVSGAAGGSKPGSWFLEFKFSIAGKRELNRRLSAIITLISYQLQWDLYKLEMSTASWTPFLTLSKKEERFEGAKDSFLVH